MLRPAVLILALAAATPALAEGCRGADPLGPEHETPITVPSFDAWLLDEAVRFYTNAERCRRGLIPLRRDRALMRAARDHSRDMARLDFFDHQSPVPGRRRLLDRFTAAGVNFRAAGENIFMTALHAFGTRRYYIVDRGRCHFVFRRDGPRIPRHSYASLARYLVEGWMASPGHRENILGSDWLRIGHGMAYRADPGHCGDLYITQNFAR